MLDNMKNSQKFCINHLNACRCDFSNIRVTYRFSSEELALMLQIMKDAVANYPKPTDEAKIKPLFSDCSHKIKFTEQLE